MKYKNIIFMCIAIIIAALLLYRLIGNFSQNDNVPSAGQKENSLLTQTNLDGAVEVKATPINLSTNGERKFDIEFTTHSVELAYDIAKISILKDDTGKEYKAISWTGGSGGHHLSGMLTFPPISKEAESITLIIPKIDGFDRIFTWDLKQ